ncbi:GNAT family N-acetyltransferase [Bacillus sp. 31A1R]|uniref:GNAT family N-acetyltransferase n=1 Tax=Robertmurraya mangrovi TaxID=3098077 RepID=A0ABU5J2A9_9BACI|nr:GNAT family N-acetyltransferase [Bacillus sp. 31A1R]MDZ5473541.1 GNAT family N-acetyltransferase [Bacillus sp. 31A1R]
MFKLETERLSLRCFREEDCNRLYQILSDPETMKFYPEPFSMEKTAAWIKKNQNRYEVDGFGLWSVCLKETNELIGDCGLVAQIVDNKREVEIGYHIDRNYWGKGYATEAAQACRNYGFENLNVDKLISIIDPENIQSIRVAEKIGFTREKDALIFGKVHSIYSSMKK